MLFDNISNFNKLGTKKNQWKCDLCTNSHYFTVRKKTKVCNDDEFLPNSNAADINSVRESIKSILLKLKKLDMMSSSFTEIQVCISVQTKLMIFQPN